MNTDTPRGQLAAQIKADNPDWQVEPFPRVPANVTKGRPVVSVWRSDTRPGVNTLGTTHVLTIQLYAAQGMTEAGENELDDYLDALMLSIERKGGYTNTVSQRATFANESLSGLIITTECQSSNVWRETILKERSI
ncbi:hypothetical protein [Arthrobacter woluwensis]|uniref:hypothetical protein n=1 Tax=Arthrobacter woluwensis TaxID=156980 RepID=UPI00119CDE59|nr:hypothetical protein [Arthrobacter woluwensis]